MSETINLFLRCSLIPTAYLTNISSCLSPSSNMKIIQLLLFLFPIFYIVHGGKNDACPSDYCGSFSLDYPFKLPSSVPRNNCTYTNLTCNSALGLGTPVVNLPYAGDFYVRFIDYYDDVPYIQLYDPGNCLMGRMMKNLNLSSSPYKAINYENYTFYTCPSDSDPLYTLPINCLSNSTNSTVAIASSYVSQDMMMLLESGCKVIGSWLLPVSDLGQFEFDGMNSDLYLTWNSTTCKACGEILDQQSSGNSVGSNPWDKFIAEPYSAPLYLALSFMFIFILLEVIKFFRKNETNHPGSHLTSDALPEYSSTATAPPQPNAGTGLDESKINFCTELVVFSENRIVQGPDCNITCSICLEGYQVGDTVRSIAKCEHCFHAQCIELWLRKNSTCPICRTVLTVAEL